MRHSAHRTISRYYLLHTHIKYVSPTAGIFAGLVLPTSQVSRGYADGLSPPWCRDCHPTTASLYKSQIRRPAPSFCLPLRRNTLQTADARADVGTSSTPLLLILSQSRPNPQAKRVPSALSREPA